MHLPRGNTTTSKSSIKVLLVIQSGSNRSYPGSRHTSFYTLIHRPKTLVSNPLAWLGIVVELHVVDGTTDLLFRQSLAVVSYPAMNLTAILEGIC